MNNDEKTNLYTLFPSYDALARIFEKYILPDAAALVLKTGRLAKRKHSRRLKTEDEFLLVLMKLRFSLPIRLLADMFGVSFSHCGRIIRLWIPFLARKFGAFVRWIPIGHRNPPPTRYSDFVMCLGIIDCFELRMEKPSDLRDARRSWSEYKQYQTAKILIAVSARGTILFLSEPWGGRILDNEIVRKDEKFMSLLKEEEKGTFVLADKGFRGLVAYIPLETGKMLVMPSVVQSGTRLTRKEIEQSRKKSNFRINVERTIGQLRCFKILKNDFLMSKLYSLPNVLRICAGIINLRPPLAK